MNLSTAVTSALPVPLNASEALAVDMGEFQAELDKLADEALRARALQVPLPKAVRAEEFPALRAFHQGLRDALFLEIPREFEGVVAPLARPEGLATTAHGDALNRLQRALVEHARDEDTGDGKTGERAELQSALAELLVFEAVRLRLLISTLSTEDYETVGGEEIDIDVIAWNEIVALLDEEALDDPDIRPLTLMHASASVALARDAALRADLLREAGSDFREELRMRARLRGALRELRLPESVLLENALASLLGNERKELAVLQEERPVALAGLSRQAMDQRVSRGRRAMTRQRKAWPRRRRPSLFDLLREPPADAA